MCVCACDLAVYPYFKASVSLMRLCCKRSSLGLLTCSAFQTHSPAARRPLAHPLQRSIYIHAHTHKHTQIPSEIDECVYAPLCQRIDRWLSEQSDSLSMRDNLSDAIYLSLPCTRSLSISCPIHTNSNSGG